MATQRVGKPHLAKQAQGSMACLSKGVVNKTNRQEQRQGGAAFDPLAQTSRLGDWLPHDSEH